MDVAGDLSGQLVRRTLGLQWARCTIIPVRVVLDESIFADPSSRLRHGPPELLQPLAAWAHKFVGLVIDDEVGVGEAAVLAPGFIEDRDMRQDAFVLREPAEHLGGTVRQIGREDFRVEAEAIAYSLNHRPGGADLCLADRAGCLGVHDYGIVRVD